MEKEIGFDRKKLLDEMSKLPAMVLSTAYNYAVNYTKYGEDVTQKWLTSIAETRALEKAYEKGYYDCLREKSYAKWVKTSDYTPDEYQSVLVTTEDGYVETAEYCCGYWMLGGEYYYEKDDIPAWQHKPAPYEEGEE